jgi:hypothetical protein
MNPTPNDGGPAFPIRFETGFYQPGLSLRDYFAAAATEIDIEEHLPRTRGEESELFKADGVKRTRVWARYRHADLMLAERDKTNGGAA